MTAPILGARTPNQPRENVAARSVRLTTEQTRALDAASAATPAFPYRRFAPDTVRAAGFDGAAVRGWSALSRSAALLNPHSPRRCRPGANPTGRPTAVSPAG